MLHQYHPIIAWYLHPRSIKPSNSSVDLGFVCVGPHVAARLEQAGKTEHRSVDGALAGVEEGVVQEAAKGAAKERGNHGNL